MKTPASSKLSLSYSLCPFFSVSSLFPCVVAFLLLSDSLHPMNTAPWKHTCSHFRGSNQYVMWQLDSGSLRSLVWFMYDPRATPTKFDFFTTCDSVDVHVCPVCTPLTVVEWKLLFSFSSLSFFLCSFSLFHLFAIPESKVPVLGHFACTSQLYHVIDSIWLISPDNNLINIKAIIMLYIFEKEYSSALVRICLCPDVYPASLTPFTFSSAYQQNVRLSYPRTYRQSNLLLCSHFPTTEGAYKLPWGAILDRLVFFCFRGAST